MKRRDLDCVENQILNCCWNPGNGGNGTLEPCLSQLPEFTSEKWEAGDVRSEPA